MERLSDIAIGQSFLFYCGALGPQDVQQDVVLFAASLYVAFL
ncbi:hypothetical protein NST54_06975 [Caldifermentibacillus hisashii]